MFAACFNFDVILGDSDDTDTHDHEHDSHSCHYGVTPWFDFAIAEDECLSFENSTSSYSVIFECHNETMGEAYLYSGSTSCSGSATTEVEITDTSMFDCESESECDILLIDLDYYGSDSEDCDGTAAQEWSFAFSDGMTCVYIGSYYWGIEYDDTDESLTMSFYADSSCDTADITEDYTTGCQEAVLQSSGYEYVAVEIEDDSGNRIEYTICNIICLISLISLFAFY